MNILLVDDEPLEVEQLEFLMQPLFPTWKFYKAYDGSQAQTICKDIKIQVAFLDINLPGKSGLELAGDLKKYNYDIEIIIVTAHQNFEYAKQSIRIGVIDYITKPVIESELKEILEKYRDVSTYSPIIIQVLDIIHEKYKEKLNLAQIASQIHINPTYLSRRFHEETGVSFSEYLLQYRIEQSKKLLMANYHLTISTVAERTGFNSQHYFSTVFRKSVGITPKEFRLREK